MSHDEWIEAEQDHQYWYNMKTREVEYGRLSPTTDRVGPFKTEEDAQNAPAILRKHVEEWDAEDEAEDPWK